MVFSKSTLFALLVSVATAAGHMALKPSTVAANSSGEVALRIGHGCSGSPTTNITVQIPVGITGVKTSAEPGWKVETTTRPISATTVNPGFSNVTASTSPSSSDSASKGSSGGGGHVHRRAAPASNTTVDTITWYDGDIPDGVYYDLHFTIKTSTTAGTYYFPVKQVCEKGNTDWVEVPENGNDGSDFKYPAPTLEVAIASASNEMTNAAGPVTAPLAWAGVLGSAVLVLQTQLV
ncbi:hypothetical protein H4R35_003836 [Dimargaris xerosporica]|nr:hypothetical protein H4R35_003836 [Dimargaris xerosporica]